MRKLLLVLVFFLGGLSLSNAQPAPDTLLITECFIGDHPGNAFAEITNMGKLPVDLSSYFIMSNNNGQALGVYQGTQYLQLEGMLNPGESYLIVGYDVRPDLGTPDPFDSIYRTPNYYLQAADLVLPNHYSVGVQGSNALRTYGGNDAIAIGFDRDDDDIWNQTLGDTVIDQVGILGPYGDHLYPDVAGVTRATVSNILIRKYSVKVGNGGDFESGRGVSEEDSDWIVVPFNPYGTSDFFTTTGRHGNSDSWSVTSSSITIDGNSMTVPWGIRRDSLYQEVDFADNMAWFMKWGPDTLESVVSQTLDTLVVYQAGDDVTKQFYGITVDDPAASMNLVFPAFERNEDNDLLLRYSVSDDFEPDTIFEVPFGTRIDTLLTYLEKASNASWAVDFMDDVSRPDLNNGDKLIVTAEDNSVKEYFIDVEDYEKSDNATLGAIYIYGDTLFGFKSNQFNYIEMLMPGSTLPVLTATPNSLNANVVIDRPTDIDGGVAERTATITVTAEDDSTELVYTVLFNIIKQEESFDADPIISQVMSAVYAQPDRDQASPWGIGFEIFNPGNTVLPLGDYIIANYSSSTVDDIVSSTTTTVRKMRPGFAVDSTRMGVGIFFNEVTYPFITDLDPGKTIVFGRGNGAELFSGNPWYELIDYQDANSSADNAYARYGFADGAGIAKLYNNESIFIIRIDNDSIFDGTKSADDGDDYTLVDIFGAQGVPNNRTIEGELYAYDCARTFERKPDIWKGNPENHGSFGTGVAGSSEWDVLVGGWYIGTHPYNPYGGYLSTVYSLVYDVSLDYGPDQTIGYVPVSTTVSDFLDNVIPNGTDVVLTVSNADSTVIKTDTDIIVTGDKLNVTSGTGINHTVYTITVENPSTDAVISSDVYTVDIDGSNGTVSGIAGLTTVEDMLANINVPNGATLNVIDDMNQQVGTETILFDTLVSVLTMVSENLILEVVAQDGISKIQYNLEFSVEEPYLTSGFYYVIQNVYLIDMFQANTVVETFLSRVTPSPGASITIVDNMGNIRSNDGIMYKDDQVIVDDGTNSVTYNLKDMFEEFSTDASLTEITVDGVSIDGFNPETMSYTLVVDQSGGIPSIPEVAATANHKNALVEVTQASDLEGSEAERTAEIVVTAEDGVTTETYTVLFNLNVSIEDQLQDEVRIFSSDRRIHIRMSSQIAGDEVSVYSITGNLIVHKKINTNFERISINDSEGIYIVKLKHNSEIYVEKVIIK